MQPIRPRLLVTALVWAVLALGTSSSSASAQAPDTATYLDPGARALLARARAARHRDIQGLSSYEGLLRERIYAGLTALRFRRERSLFEQERIARLRWNADGERAIQWLGARRAIPIVGADTRRDEVAASGDVGGAGGEVRDELRRELPDDLLRDADLPQFAFDPGGDHLTFGNDWALHPLADSAEASYRYASGDTLRIHLPQRDVVLYEIVVRPRRADFHLVAGSLWFDAESASLVRASYRPARAFNLLLDEPEDAEDVPGFLQPVEAEIQYITVEYSLQEFRFWLPRRFALEGEARLGRVVRIPLSVEWSVTDYEVNQGASQIPVTGALPPGWSRREQRVKDKATGKVSYVTVVVPDTHDLLTSSELSGDFGSGTPTAFTDQEVQELKGELQQLMPTYQRFRPQLAWGLQQDLVRYNRVEGLSVGGAVSFPLDPVSSLDLSARIGTGDREPNGVASLARGPETGRWTVSAYHRLQSMPDEENPFSTLASAKTLFLGTDRGQYFRATGASLGYRRVGDRTRLEVEAFHELQRPVSLHEDFFLLHPVRDVEPTPVLAAQRARETGGRVHLSWFSGVDPDALILTGKVGVEAAGGDAVYQRASAAFSASHPLPMGLAGALEVAAGSTWGDDLLQREFFLGGAGSLRGFNGNQFHGTSFWRGRGELASGFVGARVALFSDVGWVGPRAAFTLNDPVVSVGVGASLLDGLFRADLAHAVRGGSGLKLHLYLDGLF